MCLFFLVGFVYKDVKWILFINLDEEQDVLIIYGNGVWGK